MASVLCFGNIQFDILCQPVVSLPAPGELRVLDAIECVLSGNSGSTAAVLARLGIEVEIAGHSGADMIGEQVRTQFQALGVGTDKLLRQSQVGSGVSVITLTPDGERSIMLVNGANDLLDLDLVPDEWLLDTRLVVVMSVFVLPQFTGEAVGRFFARARARGVATLLNICWDSAGRGLPYLAPALRETDYFVLNTDEGYQLTGEKVPASIIEQLRPHTDAIILLTLGADGCCLAEKSARLDYIPAIPVEVRDSTGAGDSFIAGFCAGLLTKRRLRACVYLGNVAASFAITGPGAYARIPPLTEIDRLYSLDTGAATLFKETQG